jgi:AcrR family transcriptional regulator
MAMSTSAALLTAVPRRGDSTRESLLDAAEAMIAEHGFESPSHRTIATAAGVHVALVNYHFGSKEILFDSAVERRSRRLIEAWRAALAKVRARPVWSAEDVLRAWWEPFGAARRDDDASWRNYLCVVARLLTSRDGEAWHARHFGVIDREYRDALRVVIDGLDGVELESGFRYARRLFDEQLLYRCGKTGGTCVPHGFRDDDIDRLIAYLAGGLRALPRVRRTAMA